MLSNPLDISITTATNGYRLQTEYGCNDRRADSTGWRNKLKDKLEIRGDPAEISQNFAIDDPPLILRIIGDGLAPPFLGRF